MIHYILYILLCLLRPHLCKANGQKLFVSVTPSPRFLCVFSHFFIFLMDSLNDFILNVCCSITLHYIRYIQQMPPFDVLLLV